MKDYSNLDYSKEFSKLQAKAMEQMPLPKIEQTEIKFINIEENMKNLVDSVIDWKTTIPAVVSGASWIIGKVWGIELPQTEINTACLFIIGLLVNTKK